MIEQFDNSGSCRQNCRLGVYKVAGELFYIPSFLPSSILAGGILYFE